MAISMQGMHIDNCGFGNFYIKNKDGSLQPHEQAGVVVDGSFVPASMVIGFTGQPCGYKQILLDKLIDGNTYDIVGTAAPVGIQVHLASVTGSSTEDILEALAEKTPIMSVTSDGTDGSFSFRNIKYSGSGRYVIYTTLDPNFSVLSTANLTAQATRISVLEGTPQAVTLSINDTYDCSVCHGTGLGTCSIVGHSGSQVCLSCNGTGLVNGETCTKCKGVGTLCYTCTQAGDEGVFDGPCATCGGTGQLAYAYWSGTITGQCPAGVGTVYLSRGASSDLATLEGSIVTSVTPTVDAEGNTSYSISPGTITVGTYTAWCISDDTAFTAVYSGSFATNTDPVCLSGDTIITMADGSGKRLDELTVGDLLLGSTGPTVVTDVRRGIWRPQHILYRFEDGTVIDEISTHRFYNVEQGFWQKLERWNIGEHAKRQDGTLTALVSKECVEEEAECFGLWTESEEYFANGLLSGNAAANQPLLEDASIEEAMDMAASLTELELDKMFYGGVL